MIADPIWSVYAEMTMDPLGREWQEVFDGDDSAPAALRRPGRNATDASRNGAWLAIRPRVVAERPSHSLLNATQEI